MLIIQYLVFIFSKFQVNQINRYKVIAVNLGSVFFKPPGMKINTSLELDMMKPFKYCSKNDTLIKKKVFQYYYRYVYWWNLLVVL